jgi:archaellum component FlaC
MRVHYITTILLILLLALLSISPAAAAQISDDVAYGLPQTWENLLIFIAGSIALTVLGVGGKGLFSKWVESKIDSHRKEVDTQAEVDLTDAKRELEQVKTQLELLKGQQQLNQSLLEQNAEQGKHLGKAVDALSTISDTLGQLSGALKTQGGTLTTMQTAVTSLDTKTDTVHNLVEAVVKDIKRLPDTQAQQQLIETILSEIRNPTGKRNELFEEVLRELRIIRNRLPPSGDTGPLSDPLVDPPTGPMPVLPRSIDDVIALGAPSLN